MKTARAILISRLLDERTMSLVLRISSKPYICNRVMQIHQILLSPLYDYTQQILEVNSATLNFSEKYKLGVIKKSLKGILECRTLTFRQLNSEETKINPMSLAFLLEDGFYFEKSIFFFGRRGMEVGVSSHAVLSSLKTAHSCID